MSGAPPESVFVRVHFLDNTFKQFSIPYDTKVEDFVPRICEKVGICNVEEDGYWFGLWESKTGTSLDRPLNKSEGVGALVHGWGKDAPNKLVFLIKLLSFEVARSSPDDVVQFYRYIQAVHSVVTDQYLVDEQMAVRLAALQFRAKFGDEVEFDRHFLGGRVIEFLPQKLVKRRRTEDWNEEIQSFLDAHEDIKALSEREARSEYLLVLETLPVYGSVVYRVTMNVQNGGTPEDVLLAVSSRGIQLFKEHSQQPFHNYDLKDLLRWGYVPSATAGTFYISVKSEGGRNHVFATQEGESICESMTSYAFGWLKHADILKERAKRAAEAAATAGGELVSP